jgi:hypothetical protein
MSTIKIASTVTVPAVNAKNISDPTAWTKAQTAVTDSGKKNGIVHFYAYGLFGSAVILGGKASEIAESSGANKSQISKAKSVLEFYVAQVITDDESGEKIISVETCAEALELAVAEHGALSTAYADLFPSEPTEVSLAKAIATAVKRAISAGVNVDELLALVATEFVHQSAE